MSNKMESTGKTVDEAIREALLRMGLRREEVSVTVIQEARGGFLGVGRRAAVVQVEKKSERRRNDRNDRGGRGRRSEGGRGGERNEARGGRGRRDNENRQDGDSRRGGNARSDGRRSDGEGSERGSRRRGSRGGRGRGGDRPNEGGQTIQADRANNDNRRREQSRDDGRSRQDVAPAAVTENRADGEQSSEGSSRRRRRPRRRRKPGAEVDADAPIETNTPVETTSNDHVQANVESPAAPESPKPQVEEQQSRPVLEAPESPRPESPAPEREDRPESPAPAAATVGGTQINDVIAIQRATPFTGEDAGNQAELLQRVATGLMIKSGFPSRVQVTEGDYHAVKMVVDDRTAGVLLGRHGAAVDAIEYLVEKMASNAAGDRVRMNLDCNNFRLRREGSLEQKAENAAAEVRNTGNPVSMEPAGGRERRIVHLVIEEEEGLATYTEIGEYGKFVVVCLPDQVPSDDAPAPTEETPVVAEAAVETPESDEETKVIEADAAPMVEESPEETAEADETERPQD